ncbi:MAG: hypothetical protein OEZ16_04110, partial [Chromatiales bacterium]|nr:hypothetical protein [Chromatiales bacterium]
DILIDPTNNAHGCRGCTTFSGYTLADRKWINEWDERDRRFFFDWIRDESQIRLIEQARSRLLAERGLTREELFDYPQRLYSSLRERIERLPMRRAPAVQWQRTLINMRRDGLRREEIDWSGVTEFLSLHREERSISRESLLDAIKLDRITPQLSNELDCDTKCHLPFDEVVQRIPGYHLQMAGYPVCEEDIGVVRFRNREYSYRVGMLRHRGRSLSSEAGKWFVLGPYGKVVIATGATTPFFTDSHSALQAADAHARQSHRLRPKPGYSTTYEYMSLQGGDEYREWLVTLPDYHRSHFTAHYQERNVLLHIRTKIRVTEGGERVLFIEELQSDWMQAMARYGSSSGIPPAPFRKEWASLALKLMLIHCAKRDLDGIAWTDAQIHQLRYDREMTPLQQLYDHKVPQLLTRLARPWNLEVESGEFRTRSPWLHAARCNGCWKVEGGQGKFATRPRYDKEQALALIERHSRALTLSLPMMRLPAAMKQHILEHGLPLFGETIDK